MIRSRNVICGIAFAAIVWFCLAGCRGTVRAWGDADPISPTRIFALAHAQALIGQPQRHTIQRGETLLDVARQYDLGFNEIQTLYPDWDPWLPKVGEQVVIPSCWIVPPPEAGTIVVNVAELRLYFFSAHTQQVVTLPIGIGEKEAATPLGTFTIAVKTVHPVWTVPPSLRHKYAFAKLPPGPDNPLGNFWMGLGGTRYGIHGTDTPWSIGRLLTHGCIRLYPDDIALLFAQVPVGTQVRTIYEPVKIALSGHRVYAEVHPDVYGIVGDLVSYGFARLHARGLIQQVDPQKFYQALKRQNGLPTDVTRNRP